MSISCKLSLLISSPDKNETLVLEGEEFVFGRNAASTVHLNDPAFSRFHFKIVIDHQTLKLIDLGSSNGTFSNGVQVDASTPASISIGDLITVNNSDIQIKVLEIGNLPITEISSAEVFGIEDLSQEIINEANQRVEEIILGANNEASEIILLAKKNAAELIEKEVNEKKEVLQIELEAEKNKKLEELNETFEIDKKKLYSELEMKSYDVERNHEKRKLQLKEELDAEIAKIHKKSNELSELDKIFEETVSKKKEELEQQIIVEKEKLNKLINSHDAEVSKKKADLEKQFALEHEKLNILRKNHDSEVIKYKAELEQKVALEQEKLDKVRLDLDAEISKKKTELEQQVALEKEKINKIKSGHDEEIKKHLQLMEAQIENKKFQLASELEAVQVKVTKAEKEFASLYQNYDNQKEVQLKTLEELSAQKHKTEEQIKKLKEVLSDNKSLAELLQIEIDKIQKNKVEAEALTKKSTDIYASLKSKVDATHLELQTQEATLKEKTIQLQNIETETKKIASEKNEITSKLAPLKVELTELIKKNEAASRQNNDFRNVHNTEIAALKGQFLQTKKDLEEEMRKQKIIEEERLQNLTREELSKINKLKEDSLRIVLDLEDSITKELSNTISKFFSTSVEMTKFREISPGLEKSIRASLQTGVLKLLKNELNPSDQNKKAGLSSTKKTWKPFAIGMSISALVFGGVPVVYQYVKDQTDPVKKEREAEAARKAAAPIIRKFAPTKIAKLGTTFVDSVIYTEDFYEVVTQEKFRSGLMKEGSVYLYKQWKIDEEKSIQAYSMILSMIDVLHDKAGHIDSDYEKRDVGKMMAIEKETKRKLEKILGNEVRLDAALKFQIRFYDDYAMNEAGKK